LACCSASAVALQASRPEQRFWPSVRNRQKWQLMLPGAALYAALAALAVA
jgi:hypothetical protein